jgi:chromosome segregation ATPase
MTPPPPPRDEITHFSLSLLYAYLLRPVDLDEMQAEIERRAERMRAEEFCYSAMEIESNAKMKALQAEFDRVEKAVEGKEEMAARLDRRIHDLASETGRLQEEKNILNSEHSKIKEQVRSEEEKSVRVKRENSCQVDMFQSAFLSLMQKLVYVRDASISLESQGDEKKEILDRLDRTLFDLQVTAMHCGAGHCVLGRSFVGQLSFCKSAARLLHSLRFPLFTSPLSSFR